MTVLIILCLFAWTTAIVLIFLLIEARVSVRRAELGKAHAEALLAVYAAELQSLADRAAELIRGMVDKQEKLGETYKATLTELGEQMSLAYRAGWRSGFQDARKVPERPEGK